MTTRKRDELVTNLNLISERIGSEWQGLTNQQVEELEKLKESLWAVLCRRAKR